MTNLNDNELATLNAVVAEIKSCTGCQFGFTDNVKVNGLTKNQVKGYLGQLQKKNVIAIFEDDDVMLTELGNEILGLDFEVA